MKRRRLGLFASASEDKTILSICQTQFAFRCEYRLTRQPCLKATNMYRCICFKISSKACQTGSQQLGVSDKACMFRTRAASESYSPTGLTGTEINKKIVRCRQQARAPDRQAGSGRPDSLGSPSRDRPHPLTMHVRILINVRHALIAISYQLILYRFQSE